MPLQQQQQQQQHKQHEQHKQQAIIQTNHSNYSDDAQAISSRQLANELRELYDLPEINKQDIQAERERDNLLLIQSANIITNLNGFLKEYTTDLEENP